MIIHNTATLTFTHRYKRTKIGGLTDLADVVNTSSSVNTTQLVGTPEGTVVVPMYDWQTFLYEHTRKLIGIKSFHHLHFSSSNKGHVTARLKSDGPEVDFNLLKSEWKPTATDLPERLTPSGLPPSRQWYLFHKIREFCPEEARDVTCPKPSVPDPSGTITTTGFNSTSTSSSTTTTSSNTTICTSSSTTTTPPDPSEPPLKKSRRCGVCKGQGHNARSCPTKNS